MSDMSMKRLLSHSQTKMQLTGYLWQKILEHASVKERHVVVDFGTQTQSTLHKIHMNSHQEDKADIKLILAYMLRM